MDISIDSNVEFEMVKLPSKGECYVSKITELPVAYLTAIDENIITSATLINNRTMCDVLLEKKILDKTFNVDDLCIADREAILLWLRQTGYGDTYSYIDENGEEGEIDLSTITFKDFDQKGDEQGHFEITSAKGDIIKYRLLRHRDETEISRFIEELNNRIISETDMPEMEYYNKVAWHLLAHQIVSVNRNDDIDEWMNGLGYEDLKMLVEMLQTASPGTTSKVLELNETLFSDIIGIDIKQEWT